MIASLYKPGFHRNLTPIPPTASRMQETTHAFFFLEDYSSGAFLPAAPVLLKGWAAAKPGYFITDLRVRLGERIYPAFYGHPRPDLARYFKAREPHLLAGFEVELAIVPGENRLEFECCEISGRWLPLGMIVFTGTPCHIIPTKPSGTVGAHIFTRALRLVLQPTGTSSPTDFAATIAGFLPLPHVTRYPAVPFHGHLHHPPPLQRAEFGRVIVEGWLFHETRKIRRIAATVDLQAWQILEQAGALPYVAGLFPQFPHAAACRIHGSIDVPAQLPQPLSIRIYAELEDGTWHLCHVERSHLYGDEQHKAPYARFSLIHFARSVRALRQACLARNLAVPIDKWFFRGLREVWMEYRSRAPRSRSLPGANVARRATVAGKLPATVVLITHNLNFEGAPLFLLEYAAYLASEGVKLSVISAGEGPLRARFEALGARVDLVDITPLLKAPDARALRSALRALGQQVNLDAADLIVANTLSTYWGVHLAQLAGRRSLFYIHESTTPDSFYFGYMAPATLPVVKEAFTLATQVSFLTEATRRYYLPYLTRANHSINPGWIDLARIDRFRAENPREQLRTQLGLAPVTRLVVNIGTVCNRKGQHIFVRAVDLLWRREPELARQCEFLMVGGRESIYDQAITDLVAYLDRPNLRVVAETPVPHTYYGAAELFVCSSYEESFPRVVLEAMAFNLPIVSTNVHGIPEMARAEEEAVLVPPGDSSALAHALARVLADPELARSLADRGRRRVTAHYDSARLLPHHAALTGAVAAQPA